MELNPGIDVDKIFTEIKQRYSNREINTSDGLRIDFDKEWVHLRKSNTEPVIRIYAEGGSETEAGKLASMIIEEIKSLI